MSRKKRGCDYERKLVLMLRSMGYSAVRVAGSGCTRAESPDIIASNGSRIISFEVKSTQKSFIYLDKKTIDNLISFSKSFRSEPIVALHIKNKGWFFKDALELSNLKTVRLDETNCSDKF